MIDCYELFPGSIVKHKYAVNGEPITAYDIHRYKEAVENNDKSYYNSITGVPISKSWLLKLGFKEHYFGLFELELSNERFSTYTDKLFSILYDIRTNLLSIEITYTHTNTKNKEMESYTHSLPHIKYVHQLQATLYLLGGIKLSELHEQTTSINSN